MSTRRYSDDEVRAIFERAARRQEAARSTEDAGGAGLTLEELQEIGAASGIDPAFVAAAAHEVSAGMPPAAGRETLLGMPVVIRRERHLRAPVTDAVWEQMVAALRRQFDNAGIAGEVGRQREWTTAPTGRRNSVPVRVAVEPEGDGTRVVVEQTLRRSALPFVLVGGAYSFVAALFGVLFVAGALGSDGAFAPVMFAAMALLMLGGAQVGFRLFARHQEARFEQALDRLELIAREGASEAAPEAAPAALPEARPQLDPGSSPGQALDSLPAPEQEPEPARRTRTRA